jgi:hypothetical protein
MGRLVEGHAPPTQCRRCLRTDQQPLDSFAECGYCATVSWWEHEAYFGRRTR